MFKIGEFSRIARVPIKTLRYYDEVGLLRPAKVDPFTDYRYYSADQLARLNRILAYKDLGFSLSEISRLLDEQVSSEQLRGMLRLKEAEIRERVEQDQERLARVKARLYMIEMEDHMSDYEIVIKKVPAVRVAFLRATVPAYNQQDILWNELYGYMAAQGVKHAQSPITLYPSEMRETDPEVQVNQPFEGDLKGNGRIQVTDLPEISQMASTVHRGPLTRLGEAYYFFTQWIEKNGFKFAGPGREVYLHLNQPVRQDDPATVLEIQVPIEKV